MRSTIAYSQEEANDVNTTYVSEVGRPVDANGLASFQSQIANGLSLGGVESAVAYSDEATADVQNTLQYVAAYVDQATTTAIQQVLALGGNILKAATAILVSVPMVFGLSLDYEQNLNRDPTSQELAYESNQILNSISNYANLNWSNVGVAFDQGFANFLAQVNPISTAEAAAANTTSSQQQANQALCEKLLLNPNIVAILHAISAAENGGVYDPAITYHNIYTKYGKIKSGTPSNLSTFPTNVGRNSPSGAYAMIRDTYNRLAAQLGIANFSAHSQDLMAVWLLKSTGAVADLTAHDTPTAADFDLAVADLTTSQWAAVPGGPLSPWGLDASNAGHSTHQVAEEKYNAFIKSYEFWGGHAVGY